MHIRQKVQHQGAGDAAPRSEQPDVGRRAVCALNPKLYGCHGLLTKIRGAPLNPKPLQTETILGAMLGRVCVRATRYSETIVPSVSSRLLSVLVARRNAQPLGLSTRRFSPEALCP